ncbi:MAG: hypothetical protein HY058_22205 [Proteobacteria bacterium]|nr:hypothetical protein [Pseudomonadota bacterium]
MDEVLTRIEAAIASWHGIAVPNEAARRMAGELADSIRAFERLRGTLQFEDEPSSFEAALQATKEQPPKKRAAKTSAAPKRRAPRRAAPKRKTGRRGR